MFGDEAIEVIFKRSNFKHLTGVRSHFNQKRFFENALNGKLQVSDIEFDNKQKYHWAKLKSKHLSNITSLISGPAFLVIPSEGKFPYILTETGFGLFLSKDVIKGSEKSYYIPASLRDGDYTKENEKVIPIDFVLSCPSGTGGGYSSVEYIAPNKTLETMPRHLKSLVSKDLFEQANPPFTESSSKMFSKGYEEGLKFLKNAGFDVSNIEKGRHITEEKATFSPPKRNERT